MKRVFKQEKQLKKFILFRFIWLLLSWYVYLQTKTNIKR